jgi:ribosome-binding protein aMBF1 (putative translation factor)
MRRGDEQMSEEKQKKRRRRRGQSRIGHVLRTVGRNRKRKLRRDLLGRFGLYIFRRREEQELSIRQFARRARLPYSTIHQFEKLRKNPRLTELAKLARAVKEPLSKFLKPMQ